MKSRKHPQSRDGRNHVALLGVPIVCGENRVKGSRRAWYVVGSLHLNRVALFSHRSFSKSPIGTFGISFITILGMLPQGTEY